jgi:hypothetical protein
MHILLILLVFVVATLLARRYIFNGEEPKPPAPPPPKPPISPNPVRSVFDESANPEPPPRESQSAWPSTHAPIPPSPFGSVFDETVIPRHRADITQEKPPKLLGSIREIRRWEDEGGWFAKKKKTTAFHLTYDRASKDYGDLLVRLRTAYFKTLKLEDGDELEIDLKWKRRWTYGCVACIKNISSGQRVVPRSVSSKAGILERVEGGTTRGAV